MLSGFSPSLLKLLLTAQPLAQPAKDDASSMDEAAGVTPYDTLRAALDDEAYDVVRLVLAAGQEGPLQGYRFHKKDQQDQAGGDADWTHVQAEHAEIKATA
jgi:hypothetical protein